MSKTKIDVKRKYYLSPEHLHPVLEVAGGQEDILPDELVLVVVDILVQILLPGKADCLAALHHLHSDLFPSFLVHLVEQLAA